MPPTTHVVRQRPPIRALVIAGSAMVAGVALLLAAEVVEWTLALRIAGLLALVAGAAVFAAAWWVARSQRVEVRLDDKGYRITGPRVQQVGSWSDIGRVTRGEDRITIHRKDGSIAQLVVVAGGSADLDALGEDVARRLDADRGYGS